ncbi:hypothetical protein B0H14DRAFT_2504085 [Mycena olivaceomarginata]|nr:hypothetical protein B0H14DRAFT_2504085 [Mycena olivaceomarginata]
MAGHTRSETEGRSVEDGVPSHTRPPTVINTKTLPSGPDASSAYSSLAPAPIASQFECRQASPYHPPQLPNTLEYQQSDQADIRDFSTVPGQNSFRTFQRRHPPQAFRGIRADNIFNAETVNLCSGEAGIHILHRAVVLEALDDSSESFPQPKCHPETRTKLLDDLYHWAITPDARYSIRWLHGPAGAGKSAVMQSLCARLQDAGRLGGSFFCKGGHPTHGNAKVLFATLAYQLALHRHELKSPISCSAETDPSVLERDMDVQLRRLILEPSKSMHDPTPSILLIDGLDECEGHEIQREILRLIGSAANQGSRLRILVASRPEPHIREKFEEEALRELADAINIEQSFEDVRTYLRAEFSRIRREHATTMRNIPTPWPSSEILEMLVWKSSGYFIYASTVIKFVDDEYCRPSKQFDIIRNLVPCDSESPFEALDQLYIRILRGVPAQHRPRLCDILCVVMNLPTDIDMQGIKALLGLEPGDVSLILHPLHSVLKVPSEQHLMPIEIHHASFGDFLNSQERSLDFYVGSPTHRAKLACSILMALAYKPGDPQRKHIQWWFIWAFCLKGYWMQYITSVAPSANLVPLIRVINPDFVFFSFFPDDAIERFLIWPKI